MDTTVVVVGAGLAGLSCALRLQERGVSCTLLEAAQTVGGRVRTDIEDGFRLDRGFQVLLTAYPQTSRILNYDDLRLNRFYSGALVRSKDRFARLADPTRQPVDALATALEPAIGYADKLRILKLRNRVCTPSLERVLNRPEVSTLARLKELGFSNGVIRSFFKPFLGGIFLENELATSSRKFEFVFRMFSLGEAALPRAGMQAIPDQLSSRLKPRTLRLHSKVSAIEDGAVYLNNGDTLACDRIVLATDQAAAATLLHQPVRYRAAAATCLYFAAPKSPVKGPWLVLNGEGKGPVNNLCVPSELHRGYAPEGTSLISVTVIDPGYRTASDLETQVREQLTSWYGGSVLGWQHLRSYPIEDALPIQEPPLLSPVEKSVKLSDRLFVCGDYTGVASIEGAISSGIRAAEAVLAC
ncbi:MAG: FAD-dependent oxidoreductase [Acidobacteriota bacterium]|nr:FAD-dependent oxidoreductase [Acidobacteriota bacterium]